MKTIITGGSVRLQLLLTYTCPRPTPPPLARQSALASYKEIRTNGDEGASPRRDFPGDGNYSDWIEDAAKRTSEYKYWYITYTEGPKDREWMEECDRNYVFRLLREGSLDEKEPKLEEEVPSLFAEVQLAKRILEQEEDFVRDFLAHAEKVDFGTLRQFITRGYPSFSESLRQRHLPEQEEIIKRLPDLKPLDLSELTLSNVLQGLKANRSLVSLSLAEQQLQEAELQCLVQLIARSQTLKKLNLSGVKFNETSGRLLLDVIQHNNTITDLDITKTDLKPSIVARLKVQLKRNAKGGEFVFRSDDTKAGAAARTAGSLGNVDDDVMINLCRCAKSGKLMLDPVLASDGETYEREEIEAWFAEHDESPKTGERLEDKKLTPCLVIKRAIEHIFELNPELWEGEEIYVSAKLQKQLIAAVTSKSAEEVERIIALDKRLLTRPLQEDKHLLNLSLVSSSEVVVAVISALGDKFWELPEISDDEGVSFFVEAAKHLGAEGASIITRQLEWQQSDIQQQFTQAVAKEDLHLTGVCLDLGADIEKVADDGSRFIHRALQEEKHELLKFLIERGANREVLDGEGFSALHLAVVKGDSEALDIIIKTKSGLNIDHATGNGLSALHIACEAGNLDIATKLLEAGANPEVPMPPDNDTALIAAVRSKKLPVVEFLVAQHADINVANRLGKNALHICAELGDETEDIALAEYLLEQGVDGDAIENEGKTARELAIAAGNRSMAGAIGRKIRQLEVRRQLSEERRLSGSGGSGGLRVPDSPGQRPVSPTPEVRPDGTVGISLTIDYRELRYGLPIGQGGFGKVMRGEWRGKEVAIKELLLQSLSPKAVKSLTEEAAKMAQITIRDPDAKIVRLYGICTEPTHFGIVMELMPKGSLFNLLQERGQDLPWSIRWNIATDVAQGLALIHREGMLHRDLKSLNVLLDDRLRAKISDFGLSAVKNETRSLSSAARPSVGTLRWMAPEVLGLRPKYSVKSDVYGYGMVLWEIAACQLPYEGVEELVVKSEVRAGEREEIPEDIPPQFAELITSCWAHKPAKRPTSDQIALSLEALSKQGVFATGGGAGAAAAVSIEPASGVGGYSPL